MLRVPGPNRPAPENDRGSRLREYVVEAANGYLYDLSDAGQTGSPTTSSTFPIAPGHTVDPTRVWLCYGISQIEPKSDDGGRLFRPLDGLVVDRRQIRALEHVLVSIIPSDLFEHAHDRPRTRDAQPGRPWRAGRSPSRKCAFASGTFNPSASARNRARSASRSAASLSPSLRRPSARATRHSTDSDFRPLASASCARPSRRVACARDGCMALAMIVCCA